MLPSDIRKFTLDDVEMFKFKWRVEDMRNLQQWVFDSINALAQGVVGPGVLSGLRVVPLSGMTVRVLPGIAINEDGKLLIVNANTDVVVSSPSGNPARSLVVIRPLLTETTSTPIPTNPSSNFDLHEIQGAEVVVINGTPAATPAYPAITAGDVILMGLELSTSHSTITTADYQPGQRDQANNLRKRVNLVDDDYVVDGDKDDIIEGDATAADINQTLPDPEEYLGKELTFVKTDSSSNSMILVGTVSGVVNPELDDQYQSMTIYSNGSAWRQK